MAFVLWYSQQQAKSDHCTLELDCVLSLSAAPGSVRVMPLGSAAGAWPAIE